MTVHYRITYQHGSPETVTADSFDAVSAPPFIFKTGLHSLIIQAPGVIAVHRIEGPPDGERYTETQIWPLHLDAPIPERP